MSCLRFAAASRIAFLLASSSSAIFLSISLRFFQEEKKTLLRCVRQVILKAVV
jgi:hypothetical protein